MKKYFLFALLCIVSLTAMPDRSVAQVKEQDTIIDDFMMKGQAEKDWDSIKEYWFRNIFPQLCKENKLKFSCAHCGYILLKAIIEINSFGMMTRFHVFYQNVCGGEATPRFKMAVMLHFMRIAYPPSLYNSKFKATFGTGLKC